MKRRADLMEAEKSPSLNVVGEQTEETRDDSLVTTASSHIPHPTKQPRPGRRYIVKGSKRRAPYWVNYELFLDDLNNVRAKCVHCDSTFAADSARNGTKNLKAHSSTCKKNPLNKGKGMQSTIHLEPIYGVEGDVHVKSRVVNLDDLREALTHMIVLDELPFRFVEKPGFRHFMSLAVPNSHIPSRITIARDCFKHYIKEKDKLKDFLRVSCQRLSVTTDTWTSNQNINYMCLTGHFIDDEWRFQKRILNFCQIYSHKGEAIGSAIDECLESWGLSDKLFTVTVDNASSNDVACTHLKNLGANRGYICKGENLQMRCVAHIINLIVWDGLKHYSTSIENVRSAIKYVKASPARNVYFNELAEKSKVDCKLSLSLDCCTRWNSTYEMLNTALKYRLVFGKMKYSGDVSAPSVHEWNRVEKLVTFLKEFCDLTNRVSGSLYVTSNSLFFHISHTHNLLCQWSLDDDKKFEGMALQMKEKYDKYWGDITKLNKLIYMGVILDPCLKYVGIQLTLHSMYGAVEGDNIAKTVKKFVEKLFDEYRQMYAPSTLQSGESSIVVQSIPSTKGGSLDLMNSISEQVKMKMRGCDTGNKFLRTEFDRYLNEIMGDDEEKDVLTWWKLNEPRFPIVARMARDILAIPVSTVTSESAFSAGGHHLDQFRSSLTPKMVQALICGQDWICAHLRKKKLDMEENLQELEKLEKDLKEVNIEDELIFVTE